MRPASIVIVVGAVLFGSHPGLARAQSIAPATTASQQPDYFRDKQISQKISFRQAKPRTQRQHIILASLFGGAVAFAGAGLYFHLDSRDASDAISIVGGSTNRVYDRETADTRDRAYRSRALAIAGYSIGGALLIATVVALAVTNPGEEIVTVDDNAPAATPIVPVSIAPIPGGAMVGKSWSF